jgi:dTDP-glucose 4,6-dehydratase/UDP-glucose 4-epimerase
MKVMIIGANGSIGSRLLLHFLASGHEVQAVTTHPEQIANQPRLTISSLSKKEKNLSRLFQDQGVDLCINASGSPTVGFSFQNTEEDLYLNHEIPKMLLDAIRSASPSTKLINFSSAAVYGNPTQLPIREDDYVSPISPYGTHKAMAESLLYEAGLKGISCVSFRIFSAYGSGLKKQLFWDLAKKCENEEKIALHGTGQESRDFIHMDDICQISESYSEKGAFDGSMVNICSSEETTIHQVALHFIKAFGRAESDLHFNMEVRAGDPLNWRGDNTKLNSIVDCSTRPIEQGIREYVQWYKDQIRS